MIVGSLGISNPPYCSSALLPEFNDTSSSTKRCTPLITCSSSESKIPKLEPFSRSKFERVVKDPPLIQKSESQLSDYCSVLEGETSYDCWQAYFELKELEKEYTKEELERLIIEAGGVKSLIGCLHGVAAIHKAKKEKSKIAEEEAKKKREEEEEQKNKMSIHVHIPDGLPKTEEEMEEEEKARMPDSAYTRLLRLRGTHPAWYSPAPDHQTD